MAEVLDEIAIDKPSLQEAVSEFVSLDASVSKESNSCPGNAVAENPVKEVSNPPSEVLPLPEGWVEVFHNSGASVYFNAASRVCTWSRPYLVPVKKKVKQHGPPLASIPCLNHFVHNGYKKEEESGSADALVKKWLHNVKGNKEKLMRLNLTQFKDYLNLQFPPAAVPAASSVPAVASSVPVDTSAVPVDTSAVPVGASSVPVDASSVPVGASSVPVDAKSVPTRGIYGEISFSPQQSISAESSLQPDVQQSSSTIAMDGILDASMTSARQSLSQEPMQNVPTNSDATKVVMLPESLKKCISRISNKKAPEALEIKGQNNSDLTVLHRLMQAHLRAKIEIETSESYVGQGSYNSQVFVNGAFYGAAVGMSKKQAKHNAGSHVLGLFLEHPPVKHHESDEGEEQTTCIELDGFKGVPLKSSDVPALLLKHSLPSPWSILEQCVSRSESHLGEDSKLVFAETPLEGPLEGPERGVQFVLTLGEGRRVEGECSKPGEGGDQAAQAMFEKLYPFLSDWRAILRVYQDVIRKPEKVLKRTSKAEDCPPSKKPRHKVSNSDTTLLDKLRTEMWHLAKDSPTPSSQAEFQAKLLPTFRL